MFEIGSIVTMPISEALETVPPGDYFDCVYDDEYGLDKNDPHDYPIAWSLIMQDKDSEYLHNHIAESNVHGYIAYRPDFDRYVLMDGHHRFTAAYNRGFLSVNLMVVDPDDFEVYDHELEEVPVSV